MKRMIYAVILCLLAMLPAAASCEELTILNRDSITVKGTAVIVLEPDYADLYLGTDTFDANLTDALREYEKKINAVAAVLKEFGIEKEDAFDIQPYQVNTIYSSSAETVNSAPCIRGYRVVGTIFYRTKDVDNVGAIIDKAIQAGADSCQKIVFGSASADSAYDEAMKLAIQDAYSKAIFMAETHQAKVGKVMSMSEGSGSYQGKRFMKDGGEGQDYRQIEFIRDRDNMEFEASVTVTFALE